jgi:hypothetical protein
MCFQCYDLGSYIPEDGILHSHRRENLKYYVSFIYQFEVYFSLDFPILLFISVSFSYHVSSLEFLRQIRGLDFHNVEL